MGTGGEAGGHSGRLSGRFLRGTALDTFGQTQERRAERALISQYESSIGEALAALESTRDPNHHDAAVALPSPPEDIRGYVHVRARSIGIARAHERELLAMLQRRVIPLKQAA